jgi:hypothetical protein
MLDGLVTAIVRPLRAQYSYLELGPPRLRYGDVEYQRNDFIVSIFPDHIVTDLTCRQQILADCKYKGHSGQL